LRAMGLGNSRELELHAEAWRPWRAYAAMYLWRLASRRTEPGNTGPSRTQEAIGRPMPDGRISLFV
jgi:hypothetical protein